MAERKVENLLYVHSAAKSSNLTEKYSTVAERTAKILLYVHSAAKSSNLTERILKCGRKKTCSNSIDTQLRQKESLNLSSYFYKKKTTPKQKAKTNMNSSINMSATSVVQKVHALVLNIKTM